jgi:hypothetical protein
LGKTSAHAIDLAIFYLTVFGRDFSLNSPSQLPARQPMSSISVVSFCPTLNFLSAPSRKCLDARVSYLSHWRIMFSTRQAAAKLGLSAKSLSRYIAAKKVPAPKIMTDGSIATPRSVHIRSRMHEPNRHRRLAALRTLKIVKGGQPQPRSADATAMTVFVIV